MFLTLINTKKLVVKLLTMDYLRGDMLQKKLKAFRIDKGINSMFVGACADLNINQSDVLELLVIRWLQLRKKIDKRDAKIYDEI